MPTPDGDDRYAEGENDDLPEALDERARSANASSDEGRPEVVDRQRRVPQDQLASTSQVGSGYEQAWTDRGAQHDPKHGVQEVSTAV